MGGEGGGIKAFHLLCQFILCLYLCLHNLNTYHYVQQRDIYAAQSPAEKNIRLRSIVVFG